MRKIICFYPSLEGPNDYCARMGEIISQFADVKSIETRKELALEILQSGFFKKEIVIVSWLENALITQSGSITPYSLLRTLVIFGLVRLNFKQVIFVRHNYAPHACASNYKWLAEGFVNFIEGMCDRSIVHAPSSRGLQRTYVPHPLYKMESKVSESPGTHYVVFGRIMRYKRLETLLEKIPAGVEVHVVGDAPDKEYLRELELIVGDRKNIKLKPGYISGAEAESCIKGSRGVIVNHVDENFIVSGSAIYALSAHSMVYTLDTSVTRWLKELAPSLVILSRDIDGLCAALLRPMPSHPKIDFDFEQALSDVAISKNLQRVLLKA